MTAVTNRGKSREELRGAVYAAALSLFRSQGYVQTSVDQICAAAGVAKGTFFNVFPSKLHVLKAYYANIDIEAAKQRAKLDPSAPEEALVGYARAVEKILRREGPLMLELLDLTLGDPAMRRMDEDSGDVDAEEFAAFFAAAAAQRTVRRDLDPQLATVVLMDVWAGAMRAWLRTDGEASLTKLFKARLGALFQGLAR
jgi:AcrR family transcriptional regulator